MKIDKLVMAAASYSLAAAFTSTPLLAGEHASIEAGGDKKSQEPQTAPTTGLLMSALNETSCGDALTKAGINIYGYAQGGYFHDFSESSDQVGSTYMGLNNFKDDAVLDKISLNAERSIDPTKKEFDLGFRLEGIYGADAALIHSNGMMDSQSGRNQWDLLQAYVDVTFADMPLRLRVGKWIELAGFEHYSANIYGAFGDPSRALYSYSNQFLYGEPGTQAGALATYVASPQWSFDAGLTRGWNQSLEDGNDSLDFLGRVTYTPDAKTSVIFVMTEGPEFPAGFGDNLPPGDDAHWWTALDLVATHKLTDQLSLGLGVDYVYAPEIPGLGDDSKQWGGVAQYVSYQIDPRFTLNTRLEWYKDAANGFSNGAPVNANYYSATVGLAIKPCPDDRVLSHLMFRPEFRYDHSDQAVFGNGEDDQFSFSMDAVFTF